MSGFFISFEGGEGSGKSTQIARLAERLAEKGYDTFTTREPGGSPGGEALRHVILSGAARLLAPDLEILLFAAARADHVTSVIRPALARGSVVICDRFQDSTRVYQGLAGADRRLVAALEHLAIGATQPDLTVLLDLPAATGLARADQRRGGAVADRFESEALAVHEARRQRFLEIARSEPQRCVIVDGDRPIDDVAREVAFLALDRLDGRRREGRLPPAEPAATVPGPA
ncbi:thymidylate kinase [Aureimonas endophytica]|uniref:Thymidylate kinase n=1 Tax=Aureimonas endophytica TaxID=2027858 RepID=A0A917E1G5_9HYPH|nr:dTMP kinase [Aureimonas endophytica]GGD89085.1 thymidylate kinase [Aureimonas endophytica]